MVPDFRWDMEGTGLLEGPDHMLNHGVADPTCDYCWPRGVLRRNAHHVISSLQVTLDDLASLTGGCGAPV